MNTSSPLGPEGFRRDAKGCWVPESLIKPLDQMRDELVRELAEQAKAVRETLRAFRERCFADVGAFVALSGEQYGVHLGGRKGNITLYSFDGAFKLQLAVAEHWVFDERLQAAKALIDACIMDWSQGSRDEIKMLVQSAFQTDREGKINTARVLSLRRLDIQAEMWQRAMKAISDSLLVVGSKEYVRFYERVGEAQYQPISLDIAAVECARKGA